MDEPPERKGTTPSIRRLLRAGKRVADRLNHLLSAAERLEKLPAEEPPPGIDQLTPTETELIKRIVDPADDKYSAIWTSMGMSKFTFDTHLASIFQKLRVHKRSGLVRVAVMWGLA